MSVVLGGGGDCLHARLVTVAAAAAASLSLAKRGSWILRAAAGSDHDTFVLTLFRVN